MKNIAIIGSGTWGCALAICISHNVNNIKIWSFSEEECNIINSKRKCKFLKNDAILPENITCFNDYKSVIENSDIILHVTPSKVFRKTLNEYKKYITNQPIILCSKGMEPDTLLTLNEVLEEELPNSIFGVLSGPSHAEEVSINLPTALVIASKNEDLKKSVFNIFKSPTIKMYSSNDVKGVEVGGVLKNIIALCAGLISGLGFGNNAFAALLTRGLKEITESGLAMGGKKDTFYGLTGLGDLILTCSTKHSRNRSAGELLAKGLTLKEVEEKVGMVIEGIDSLKIIHKLILKYKINAPIITSIYEIIFNGLDPQKAIENLMAGDLKEE